MFQTTNQTWIVPPRRGPRSRCYQRTNAVPNPLNFSTPKEVPVPSCPSQAVTRPLPAKIERPQSCTNMCHGYGRGDAHQFHKGNPNIMGI